MKTKVGTRLQPGRNQVGTKLEPVWCLVLALLHANDRSRYGIVQFMQAQGPEAVAGGSGQLFLIRTEWPEGVPAGHVCYLAVGG